MAIPPPHNLTLINGTGGFPQLANTVNQHLMNELFGVFILVAVFFIMGMSMTVISRDPAKAALIASFCTFIIALFMRSLNLINDLWFFITLALLALIAFGSALARLKN